MNARSSEVAKLAQIMLPITNPEETIKYINEYEQNELSRICEVIESRRQQVHDLANDYNFSWSNDNGKIVLQSQAGRSLELEHACLTPVCSHMHLAYVFFVATVDKSGMKRDSLLQYFEDYLPCKNEFWRYTQEFVVLYMSIPCSFIRVLSHEYPKSFRYVWELYARVKHLGYAPCIDYAVISILSGDLENKHESLQLPWEITSLQDKNWFFRHCADFCPVLRETGIPVTEIDGITLFLDADDTIMLILSAWSSCLQFSYQKDLQNMFTEYINQIKLPSAKTLAQ